METKDFIDKLVKGITKDFGEGSCTVLGEKSECGVSEWVSTGSTLINKAIGRPGVPIGRLTSINGKPAVGKTTAVAHLLSEVQKMGGVAVLLDTEHAFVRDRAERIGLDVDKLVLPDADTVEGAFEKIYHILRASNENDVLTLIAWDSFSGTQTKAEVNIDDDASRGQVGEHARLAALHLRKLCPLLDGSRCGLVLVNQIKTDVGAYGYGPKETILARAPIWYHSSVIMKVSKLRNLDGNEGIRVKYRVEKNKVAPPLGEAEIDITNESGYCEDNFIIDKAVALGLLGPPGRGGYYTLGEEKFRRKEILSDKDLLEKLKAVVDKAENQESAE